MLKPNIPAAAYSDTKPHYEILNGLRGVAAIMVIFYPLAPICNRCVS